MTSIFNNGVRTCVKDRPRRTSLMYKCHNKKYLGAAQGLSGVLYCLLLVCFNFMNTFSCTLFKDVILVESFPFFLNCYCFHVLIIIGML